MRASLPPARPCALSPVPGGPVRSRGAQGEGRGAGSAQCGKVGRLDRTKSGPGSPLWRSGSRLRAGRESGSGLACLGELRARKRASVCFVLDSCPLLCRISANLTGLVLLSVLLPPALDRIGLAHLMAGSPSRSNARGRGYARGYMEPLESKRGYSVNCNPLILLEPPAGIEPATY